MQSDFLLELLPMLGDFGLGAYLETNGTLAEELALVLPHLDTVCADIKLPSSTKQPPIWGMHERFLLTLAANEDPGRLDFAKAVITADCPSDEIETAARLIAAINDEMLLVLQPVTSPVGPSGEKPRAGGDQPALQDFVVGQETCSCPTEITPPSPKQSLEFQAIAKRYLAHVRVIPQMHRVGGWL